MLVDTDVVIWYLRGLVKASVWLNSFPQPKISAISYLELVQGMRNRAELIAVQRSLNLRNVERLPVTPAITETATNVMETLSLSHGLRLADTLIAATAIEHQLILLTGNVKHFSAIPRLQIERFDP